MSKPFKTCILILAVCCAVLLLTTVFSSTSPDTTSRKDADIVNSLETAGNQMLWESLSQQFVSSVQY